MAATAVLLVVVSLVALRHARRRPYLIVGWLWFVGKLVPVIGLVQVGPQAMADRYTYVPLVGIFIMLAWSAGDAVARWRVPSVVPALAVGAILAGYFALTRVQVGYWHDGITLFEHVLAVTRDNHIAHFNLGAELARRDRTGEALEHYREALRIAPNFPEAIRRYHGALRLDPKHADAHYGLGNTLAEQGKLAEAILAYGEALRARPELADAHNNLGLALVAHGRMEEAIPHYSEAVRISPAFAQAYYNRGVAERRLGATAAAEADIARARARSARAAVAR